jgi:hypothetical protein
MSPFRFVLLLVVTLLPAAAVAEEPVSVMIVGTFHFGNPNRDMHDVKADDMLAPKRQAEIADVVAGLARFKPTVVDIEWPADIAAQRYDAFRKGTLKPSPNESVQLGLRLAETAGASIHGIDVDGDFPYDPVAAFAKAHGETALLDEGDARVVADVAKMQTALDSGTLQTTLRIINDPEFVTSSYYFYGLLTRIGAGTEQPGADLLTAWHRRNFLICANLVQSAKPGDRVVVIYGSGHAYLLRQCVQETPGFRTVEANDYLPR